MQERWQTLIVDCRGNHFFCLLVPPLENQRFDNCVEAKFRWRNTYAGEYFPSSIRVAFSKECLRLLRDHAEVVRRNVQGTIKKCSRFGDFSNSPVRASEVCPNIVIQRVELGGLLLQSDRFIDFSLAAFHQADREN